MDNVQQYKSISIDIIKLFEVDNIEKIEKLINKREKILKEEIDNEIFKENLINEGILEIDLRIKQLLNENIDKIKIEIKEYKVSKQANKSYLYNNQSKINIFNEKV